VARIRLSRQHERCQRQLSQRSKMNRLIIFAIIASIYVATKDVLESINGDFYYCSVAFFELITLFCLSFVRGRISRDMQVLNLALIIGHLIGWALYASCHKAIIYQIITYGLMSAQLLRLLWAGKHDGDTESDSSLRMVWRNHFSSDNKGTRVL
jgi:hypothetical protein